MSIKSSKSPIQGKIVAPVVVLNFGSKFFLANGLFRFSKNVP